MYAQDNDDDNPMAFYPGADGNLYAWFGCINGTTNALNPDAGLLSPYTTGAYQIQDCPSSNLTNWISGPGSTFGYGVNNDLYPNSNTFPPPPNAYSAVNLAAITSPANTLLLTDSATVFPSSKPTSTWYIYPPSSALTYGSPTVQARHNGRANVLWYDNHVSSTTLAYLQVSDAYGNSPSTLQGYNLGFVMPSNCAIGNTTCQDYYYQLNK